MSSFQGSFTQWRSSFIPAGCSSAVIEFGQHSSPLFLDYCRCLHIVVSSFVQWVCNCIIEIVYKFELYLGHENAM